MNKLHTVQNHLNSILPNDSISYEEKEVLLRQALIDYPEDEAGILHLLMMTLAILEKDQECIEVCERIIPLLDENDEKMGIYLYEGKRYIDLEQEDKAIECFNKSIECDNSHFGVAETVGELADIYKERLEWENVIKTYDFITDDEKYDKYDKTDKHFQQGYAYAMINEFEKAIKCYDKYLEIEPEDTAVLSNLGAMYGNLNNWDKAIEIFNSILKINPEDEQAYYSLGVAYNGKGDYLMAMHNYLEALKIKPDYLAALNNFGAITANDLGNVQEGIDLLEKALDLAKDDDPYKGFLIMNLCKINKHLTNFERADYYEQKLMNLLGFDVSLEEGEDEEEDDDE